jgi:hypothetical protein
MDTIAKARRTLKREYRRLGTWRRLADELKIKNVSYVYKFTIYGIIPANKNVQRLLGLARIPRGLAAIDRDMKLPIQDMPADSLRAAFIYRTDML